MYSRYAYQKQQRLYLTEQDYKYFYIVDPLRYITNEIEKRGKDFAPTAIFNCLQNEIRATLYIFLNYPFILPLYRYYKKKFLRLLPLIEYLDDKGLGLKEFRSKLTYLKDKLPTRPMYFCASLFCSFYREFSVSLQGLKRSCVKKTKPVCPMFRIEKFPSIDRDEEYLEPLRSLQVYGEENFSEHVIGFYLHGSFATTDYIRNWSDVDTLLILKKETLLNVERLLSFQKMVYKGTGFFYLMDPFQSHGFFTLTEYDIDYYPESYFPLELFKHSKSFLRDDVTLEFKVRDCNLENMAIFWQDALHYVRRMLVEKKGQKSLRNNDIRMLLHKIYIFPVFYLQAKGIHCYKRFSFDMAKEDFTDKEWGPVETANNIWRTWEANYGYRFLPKWLFFSSPILTSLCLKTFYNGEKNLFQKYHVDYWKLLVDTNRLFETTWAMLSKEIPNGIFC